MRERGLLDRAVSGVHSDLSLTRQALAFLLPQQELHSRSISIAATVPERLALFCKNDMNLAAEEKIDELFPSAAVPAIGFVFSSPFYGRNGFVFSNRL